jgi:hypothetical protein
MKTLLTPLMWILAAAIVIGVLWRRRSGRNVILQGSFSPRLIHMIAVLLVLTGSSSLANEDDPIAASAERFVPSSEWPEHLDRQSIIRWVQQAQLQLPENFPKDQRLTHKDKLETFGIYRVQPPVMTFLLPEESQEPTILHQRWTFTALHVSPALAAMLKQDERASEAKMPLPPHTPESLAKALEEAESRGFFSHLLIRYLWQASGRSTEPPGEAMAQLYTKLRLHARTTNALTRTAAMAVPVVYHPWMSKAAPRRDYINIRVDHQGLHKQLLANLARDYSLSDAGTWKQDARVEVELPATQELTIISNGEQIETVGSVRLGRLDLVLLPSSPVAVHHAVLGDIIIPAAGPQRKLLTVWQLPDLMDATAQRRIDTLLDVALEGDEAAARQLETVLPFAHDTIRSRLKEASTAKGAPRLRLILTQFDELVAPQLQPKTDQ